MDDHVAVTRSDPPGRKADDHVGVETFERQQVPRKARVLQRVRAWLGAGGRHELANGSCDPRKVDGTESRPLGGLLLLSSSGFAHPYPQ